MKTLLIISMLLLGNPVIWAAPKSTAVKEVKDQWSVFRDTTPACSFSFEHPKAWEVDTDFTFNDPEDRKSRGILSDVGFFKELGDPYVHPINISLSIESYDPSVKVRLTYVAGVDIEEKDCHDFPFKNKVSTMTAAGGYQATEYRYCVNILGESSMKGTEGLFPDFPHELIIRIIKFPTCSAKLVAQLPMVYEKDFSKIDSSWPPKDTPKLKKKKQDIRIKLFRSLNSFRLETTSPP